MSPTTMSSRLTLWTAALALPLAACNSAGTGGADQVTRSGPAAVDQTRIEAAASDVDNWMSHGRTYAEERFSPLDQVNDQNVGNLKLAWYGDFDTIRGQEATPIVVDGVMYVSTAWSKVYAFDAATGRQLWKFDPQNNGAKGVHACCDVVNRGVAVWKGKVYVGTIDGRLIAIDAATGKQVWSVVTVDQSKPYTITSAPRVVRDKVIIGNSGAELGVRGYITAYDAASGKQVWRFYTVPGNPADGPDGAASDEAFAKFARNTWNGEWWKLGGGGTVWDAIVYDQELNTLLIGVGNGSPWNHRLRSAGKGDNLFLSSILALDPDTGKYKWHYQETPAETWDFTATQNIILTTLDLKDGAGPRKVLMHAPKNGFFFMIDRTNGRFLSATPYVPVGWATGYDANGRPMENPDARFKDKPFTAYPSGIGAHAWMPMSFSPKTGLVYIPAMEVPLTMTDDINAKIYPGRWNTGTGFTAASDADKANPQIKGTPKGELIAWDPVAKKEVWRHPYDWAWNGGTLATGGNLVFQGSGRGWFQAFAADTGRELWKFEAHRGVLAGPITYRVNGEQYVAVLAGYGGSMGVATNSDFQHYPQPNGQVLVFKLGGKGAPPPVPNTPQAPLVLLDEQFPKEKLAEGAKWYGQFCRICHNGPVNPDLRRSSALMDAGVWKQVVIDGALQQNGMASFKGYLTPEQADSIRAYVAQMAKDEKAKGGT